MRQLRAAAGALLCAILVSACGAGGGGVSTNSPSPMLAPVEGYIGAISRLAEALDEVVASQGSGQSVERALERIDEAVAYAPYFASLTRAEANDIAQRYGNRVQAISLRIATSARQAIDVSGDGRILDALQNVPSFVIATSTQAPSESSIDQQCVGDPCS